MLTSVQNHEKCVNADTFEVLIDRSHGARGRMQGRGVGEGCIVVMVGVDEQPTLNINKQGNLL